MIVLIILMIAIVLIVISFFIWKHYYIKRLKEVRDNLDFTTPEGKWLIGVYNKKIDELNGYHLWN